ncbi:type I restriction enzyme HsdR N-terminal domain-containing protein [Marinoscillum luteum]|uniref:Type I restriction enzyme HsdR N-terminal domain-containing protein n=1 Tax=Marinoscillum luteum TaxID=861051 RepID=A0ABW7NA17_9BACT
MQKLNLPPSDFKLKSEEGNQFIFDIVRKKYLVLTPEEWVRQHFIHLMVNHLAYPKSLIKVETGLAYFKSAKRSDIMLCDREGSNFLLVECKAADVKIDRKALNQVSVYNKELKARYVALTNGMVHFIWEYRSDENKYYQLKEFPKFV